ncbi:MAG TPA: Dabb family protein [Vicinamibacterales bacterium]|nr:Dabb family protein [Vicinamibacterales bacterium]
MISHVVLFKPRADLSLADREALVAAFERATREIQEVRGFRVGRRVTHGAGYEQRAPDIADVLVVIDFDNLDALQAYLRHPAHVDLGVRFAQTFSSGMVYDFELGLL